MTKAIYVGVSDRAKKVKSIYVGVNDYARRIKSIYVGVNGVAHKCYASGTGKWWLPAGLTDANIIAAYRWKGANSEAEALLNVNSGTVYTLSKLKPDSVKAPETWSKAEGFMLPSMAGATTDEDLRSGNRGLDNANLKAQVYSVKSLMMFYGGYNSTSLTGYEGGAVLSTFGKYSKMLFAGVGGYKPKNSSTQHQEGFTAYGTGTPGYRLSTGRTETYKASAGTHHASAVVGYSTNTLWLNGYSQPVTQDGEVQVKNAKGDYSLLTDNGGCFGHGGIRTYGYSSGSMGGYYRWKYPAYNLYAAVVLNVDLTSAQALELYQNMILL